MRRFFIVFLCCLLLTTTVSAASTVTELTSSTLVSDDGTCQVTLTLQLRLEEVPAELVFPLNAGARDITLNGSAAQTELKNGLRCVDLTDAVSAAGTHTLVIHYTLPDAVAKARDGKLYLTLDILSGFAYPIAQMAFTVTLPGMPEAEPTFVSTYLQEGVEAVMDRKTEGSTISCTFTEGLKDHDWLTMTLQVSDELFHQSMAKKWNVSTSDLLMYLFAAAAALYWLATMRCLPPRRTHRAMEPDGLTAGELGCCICGQGVDFTMMVLSWARMGYLLIHMTDSGRVLLHKRMDMGNERSDFESRCFRNLFGRRVTVDGTGFHYARLCRKASKSTPRIRSYFRRGSGNPMVFRVLAAGVGFLGGVCLAAAFVQDTAWRVILSIVLSVAGAAVAWQIQGAGTALLLRRKQPLLLAGLCSLLWALLCAWAGAWSVAVFVLLTQWLASLAAAFGGKRTELGRQTLSEILGLRRYMRTANREELYRILKRNPDYYYSLAPYALALGVDRAFAHRFGSRQLPACAWLTTGMDGHMTAREWNQLLRDTVAALDERQQRPFDKLTGK